jgi:N-acetylmuramoyl-L-alanine amidase
MRLPVRSPRALTVTAGLPFALAGSFALALAPQSAHAAPADPATWDEPRDDARPHPAAPPAPLAAALSAPAEHVVEPGDTVSAIAGRYGLRTADVLAANGLGWSTIIRPGQVLRLGAAAPQPAASVAPAPAAATARTVRAGDTVSAIARAAGVSTDAVLAANGLTRASIIYPGQTLLIPGPADAAPPAPAAPVVAAAPAAAPTVSAAEAVLDAEQTANAQLIIRVGRELGVPDRGIAIALGTAMVESWLRNLDWGDRDSLGLFQQRPSTGWGTAEQILDPVRSARAFYGGSDDPNGSLTRGLLDVPGWQGMSFADAAQAVQISAYPERYARWEQAAAGWLAALG